MSRGLLIEKTASSCTAMSNNEVNGIKLFSKLLLMLVPQGLNNHMRDSLKGTSHEQWKLVKGKS